MEDYIEAHEFCNNNMEQLKKDKKCGCFYCLKIFSPQEIENWLISENENNSAICPYCCVDSVISESSGYPITEDFLSKMKKYWFR